MNRPSSANPEFPMTAAYHDTAVCRWLAKEVHESRVLDTVESLEQWSHRGYGRMLLTNERGKGGGNSVRIVSPTKSDIQNQVELGRPFGCCAARRNFDREDWTAYNRLSFWVYPDLPGFSTVSMLVQLYNEGAITIPDKWEREGLNFFLLKNHEWNRVVWEIAHLPRECVTGVEFVYRLQGHEPGAADTVSFDIGLLELDRVDADHFEGWNVAPGRIAFCHTGYRPAEPKRAVATGIDASSFLLLRACDGTTVLEKHVETEVTRTGSFQILDFTECTRTGEYVLRAGDITTQPFRIADDIWERTIWKTLNFFFCERCGCPVPGIHDACHRDWQVEHDGKRIVINGGWHDAGDLSQGLGNTSGAVTSMLDLARKLGPSNPALAARLREEALWGLEWVRKTRFDDGARAGWCTIDFWTDGVIGTPDDIVGTAWRGADLNYSAALAQAKAFNALRDIDAAEAQRALNDARKDWSFAVNQDLNKLARPWDCFAAAASKAILASTELWRATGEKQYADHAIGLAQQVVDSQERAFTEWSIPLCGFFYTDSKREKPLRFSHTAGYHWPAVALAELCALFPDNPGWMSWYAAVALHTEHLRAIAGLTNPFGMLSATPYSLDESQEPDFQKQVRQGIPLGGNWFLRMFPVWDDKRGNYPIMLGHAKSLARGAHLRGAPHLMALCELQLQWMVGRNPFCQSTMYGEGHDYAPQYTAMCGDMVGSLPVGTQTCREKDVPYWPAANCYNFKEVWVQPSLLWLWVMADLMEPLDLRPDRPVVTGATTAQGEVRVCARLAGARGGHRFEIRTHNLMLRQSPRIEAAAAGGECVAEWTAAVERPGGPWVAVVVADGDIGKRGEAVGSIRGDDLSQVMR